MSETLAVEQVAANLSPRLPIYRWRRPVYQTVMLRALKRLWSRGHRKVLDVGGGTGVIAQAVHDLFPVETVVAVDVEDRYLKDLTISAGTYDGLHLPFADDAFDAVMFNNVLHHVPVKGRAALMRECRRVAGDGPVYIKDHLAASALDHKRLWLLDWIGNTPFSGMVEADYLDRAQWDALAAAGGYRIAETLAAEPYRSGPMALLFPNRLEISMRWEPAPG